MFVDKIIKVGLERLNLRLGRFDSHGPSQLLVNYSASNPGRYFSLDVFSQNVKILESYTGAFRGQPNIRMLEVGCFEGQSTLWFAENFCDGSGSIIEAIDSFHGMRIDSSAHYQKVLERRFRTNLRQQLDDQTVQLNRGLSKDILLKFLAEKASGRRKDFDIVYIDGGHHPKMVIEDLVLTWEVLRPGGLMIVDDYGWVPRCRGRYNVKAPVDLFLQAYKLDYRVLHKDYQVHLRKLAFECIPKQIRLAKDKGGGDGKVKEDELKKPQE